MLALLIYFDIYVSILPEDAAHQGSCPEVVYVRATLSFGSADWSTVL